MEDKDGRWKIRLGDGLEDTDIFQISTSLLGFRLPLTISELEKSESENGRYGRFFTQLILFKLNLEHTRYMGKVHKKTTKCWNQLLVVYSTQTRARTGMGCPTGVWDQRVYRFRHLGIGVLRVQRYAFYFVPQNFWSKSFAETVSLRAFLLFYF